MKAKLCESCKVNPTSSPTSKTCSITCRNRLNARNSNKNRNYEPKPCEHCKAIFTPHSTHAKYCKTSCQSKASRLRNPEYYEKRDRIRVRKNTLGLNIRDEYLSSPTRTAKWLWDGEGKWSTKYWPDITECLECGTNAYKHIGNGICCRCYDKLRGRDEERLKKLKQNYYIRKKEEGKPSSYKEGKYWIEKAKKAEIPITPKIENILDNLLRL